MNVLFVARAFHNVAGGVERMVTAVMNALVARGHSINLLTWDQAGAAAFFPMTPEITWHSLNIGNPSVKAGPLLRIRRAVVVRDLVKGFQPDVIVCFQAGPFMAIRTYTVGMGIPVIAAERNAPTRFDHIRGKPGKPLTCHAFRFARRILIQCRSYRDLYPAFLRHRIVTIPNPVFPADGRARPEIPDSNGRFRILSIGRLGYQKNYPVLIEAFAMIASTYSEWDLVIIGEGEDRSGLEKLVMEKGLARRIAMPGTTALVSKWYTSSHLFCLPSRWEGFPNALAEALSHGLPSVGFAGCAGVPELIVPGENGLLVEGNGGAKTLAGTLEILMSSAEERKAMGTLAAKSVRGYEPDKIFSLWERTLAEATMNFPP